MVGIIFALSLAIVVFIAVGKVFSDSAGTPFSTKLATSVQAWYDETWQATGFYRLDPGSLRYSYTNTPTTNSNPTIISATNNTFIPQDMVVTEWSVTGHVHFSSSGM